MLETIRRAPRAFIEDRSGNTAMLFGLSIVPLLGMAGVAIDYSNAMRLKTDLQNVVDTAALAGATEKRNGGTEASARAVAQAFVASHYNIPGSSTPTVTSAITASGALSLSATTNVNTYLTRLIDIATIPVTARTEVTTDAGKLEVAIALDTTGSMDPANKLVDAKTAAANLIDQIVGPSGVNPLVKISLVPFNYYVNIGTANKGAAWLSNSDDVTSPYAAGCQDTYPNIVYGAPINHFGTVDGVYKLIWTEYPVVSYGAKGPPSCWPAGTNVSAWPGTVGSRNYPLDLQADVNPANPVPAVWNVPSPASLVRLTSNAATVKAQIASLTASDETYIAPGLLWAWRTLSPNAPFSDGAAYGAGTKKIMILMTDGANTHSPNYPDHEATNVSDANDITKKTCHNAKARGIVIYTIAFQVTDATIKGILQNCASAPVNYYDATSNQAMLDAFKAIANNLTQLRVSK